MWSGKDTEGSDCSLLQRFCCSEFAWTIGINLQKFHNELSKLSGRESKTGPVKIRITINGYYVTILGPVLRNISRDWAPHSCYTPSSLEATAMCSNYWPCIFVREVAYTPGDFHFLFCWCLNFSGFVDCHC